MSSAPVLFLDFDGVLHPAPVWRQPDGRLLLDADAEAAGRVLFDRATALAAALSDINVRLVLSSSWVQQLGYNRARGHLPPGLQCKVIGATYHSRAQSRWVWYHYTRWEQIQVYVRRHALVRWLAIDDDAEGWPDGERHRLICTDPYEGISAVQIAELVQQLRAGRTESDG